MDKFEYLNATDITNEKMNRLGDLGWELVAVIQDPGLSNHLYFKRKIVEKWDKFGD